MHANDNSGTVAQTISGNSGSSLFNGCCLKVMAGIPDHSVHLFLCDLPYGTTNCPWDSVIDLAAFWAQVRRILTPTGAVIMFGSQPFTTALIVSNKPWFKYGLIWEKSKPTGFLQAGQKLLKAHEDVLVFSPGTTVSGQHRGARNMTYNPQGLVELAKPGRAKTDVRRAGAFTQAADKVSEFCGKRILGVRKRATHTNFPRSVLRFASVARPVHSTQKPVDLCEYLIRTFTNEGEVVLDPTMGVGTTGVAARQANRLFIGIERDPTFFGIAEGRIGGPAFKKAA